TVFIHILSEDGRLIAQHDTAPAFGTRPTSSWVVGEQILDKHRLTIPIDPVSNGTIVVGLYNSATLERQPFDDGELDLWLADVVGTAAPAQ
ncbi:MAG: hypothetical protein WAM60_09410, partial [Candidatus Promineifilaceae bacterium]